MNKLLKLPILASLALILLIFGYFSFNAPYMADNYVFSRDLRPGFAAFYTGNPVSASPLGLESAFRQACDMYTSWCGRFMGNLAVYLLFLLPPALGHLISTLAFGIYIILLQICVFGHEWREKLSPGWLLALAALVWLSIPSFGEAFLWLSVGGQIALFAQIFMLLPYRLALSPAWKGPRRGWSACCLAPLFLLAGLAASSLDFPTSASLPVTTLAALAYIYYRQQERPRKIPWILLAGALGLLLGGALTLLAPGNAQRLLLTHDDSVISWLAMSWPERIGEWLLHLPLLLALFPIPLLILVWGLFALGREKGKKFLLHIPIAALFFLLPFLLSIGAFLFSAWPPPRAFAGCAIQLLLAALIIAVRALPRATASLQNKWRTLTALLTLCAIISIVWQAWVFHQLHQAVLNRENIISSTAGDELILPPLAVPANSYQPLGGELADISEDPDFWVNRAMALHYGFKTVRRQPPPAKAEYRSEGGGPLAQLDMEFAKDRFLVQTRNSALAAQLEKGAYIYYYGRPALLARLWTPLANRIYAFLTSLKEDNPLLHLVPLLMARADLSPLEVSGTGYLGRGPLVRLDKAGTVWLVRPGKGKTSFDLLPFRMEEEGSSPKAAP